MSVLQYKCEHPGCGKRFLSREALRGHKSAHADENGASSDEPVPCPDCDREFETTQGLGAHRVAKHGWTSDNKKTAREHRYRASVEACTCGYSGPDVLAHVESHTADSHLGRGSE